MGSGFTHSRTSVTRGIARGSVSLAGPRHRVVTPAAGLLAIVAFASPTLAQIDPATGIEFVTVGAVGNASWAGNGTPGDRAIGRGIVNYEYRIGKYEVKSDEWAEFFDAALNRPAGDEIPFVTTPFTTGGFAQPWRATGGITWRTAAIYTNWLHNGKATNREAFLSGAYEVSTFGFGPPGTGFSDQRERSPGARYFIPSWDEWLKAAHYDPSKQNSDGSTGGWWLFSNGTDAPLIYAPPPNFGGNGTGMANSGFDLPGGQDFMIPLNSYPNVRTPWGLIDAAGMTSEWTEEARLTDGFLTARTVDGSAWTDSPGEASAVDLLSFRGGDAPDIGSLLYGFRIAAVVPTPGFVAFGIAGLYLGRRRTRQGGFHVAQIEVVGVSKYRISTGCSDERTNKS